MTLLVVGVSHHTTAFVVLERLSAIDPASLRADLLSDENIAEVIVVSTCNRMEVYAEVGRFHSGVDAIVRHLAHRARLSEEEMTSRCFVHFDERAVQHLFEVASGLDSMVVGEQQILGQVRSAFADAQRAGAAGRELGDLAQAALRVGKDVRSATGIDKAGASIVSVGLELALQELDDMAESAPVDPNVAVLGSGSMSGLTAAALARGDVGRVTLVSRNQEQGRRLAQAQGGTAARFEQLPKVLVDSDLVICCTGAAETVVSLADVAAAVSRRPGRPLVVLDLALPHDSDPGIAELPGVSRIDLADLSRRRESRPDLAEVAAARKLIDEELLVFAQERAARSVEPVVLRLRSRASTVVEAELERMRGRLTTVEDSEWEQVERGVRRVVATLLHTPTIRVKQLAADPDGQRYAHALSSLFDLSVDAVDAVDAVVLPREAQDYPSRDPEERSDDAASALPRQVNDEMRPQDRERS
jgi:glutamyl-tRNA reductase